MPKNNTKAMRIILELLHQPNGTLTKYRIAKETKTNISWVITFLRRLEQKKIVKGTKVKNKDALINYYLSLEKKRIHLDFHLPQPLDHLKNEKKIYALTTYSAENLVSHHLFPSRLDIYIREEDVPHWKTELFKKGLLGDGNTRLIIAYDNNLFKYTHQIKGFSVVSLPILLIDLKREGGVCLEAYNYLVKKYVP